MLESPARELMLAAFTAWLLPLAAVLLGVASGYLVAGFFWPASREIAAAVSGLAMLFPGFYLVKKAGGFFGTGKILSPRMVRIVDLGEPGIRGLVECNRAAALKG